MAISSGTGSAAGFAVDRVLFVHGYSVRQFSAYAQFPAFLAEVGIPSQSILLSAFLSLDDNVTCDDLAHALEDHVTTQIEAQGGSITRTAVVCHSTGALVARRWILNRLGAGLPTPSHLITYAGANHGSTMAQLGRTIIARLFREIVQQSSVGQRVLADLDYGSAFLWQLNDEWLDAWNAGRLDGVYCFSLGGDNHGGFPGEVIWQVGERGSDSIVRVSGANLNYTRMDANPQAARPVLRPTTPVRPTAHLVIPGYTHGGIIGDVKSSAEPPFQALLQVLRVGDAAAYQSVLGDWAARTQTWTAAHPDQANSTIVFRVRDEDGRSISDHLILIQDDHGSAPAVSDSLEPHQPIQNEVDGSSISFYLNHAKFMTTRPHVLHVEARSGSPYIDYVDIDYRVADPVYVLVKPNEFTYVDLRLSRDVTRTYVVVPYSPTLDVKTPWPPLP
ncbi:MAG TPA: hypothetical protein VGX97_05390 [bacterium]|nr:hypothetical protein [bacterium]